MTYLAQSLMIQCSGDVMSATGERMCTICDLLGLLDNVKNIAVQVGTVMAIAMLVYGGYVMMVAGVSGGSVEEFKKGKTIVKNAFIGLALLLSAYLIVSEIFRILAPGGGFKPWDQISC